MTPRNTFIIISSDERCDRAPADGALNSTFVSRSCQHKLKGTRYRANCLPGPLKTAYLTAGATHSNYCHSDRVSVLLASSGLLLCEHACVYSFTQKILNQLRTRFRKLLIPVVQSCETITELHADEATGISIVIYKLFIDLFRVFIFFSIMMIRLSDVSYGC